jgi:hypothetical protein
MLNLNLTSLTFSDWSWGWAATSSDSIDGCCHCRILFFFVVDHFYFAPAHSNVDNPGRGGDSVHASVMLGWGWTMGASHALLQCNPVQRKRETHKDTVLYKRGRLEAHHSLYQRKYAIITDTGRKV